MAQLGKGERSATELGRPFDMTLAAISKHLRVLERAGLISRGRKAQWRPCRIQAGPMQGAANWLLGYRHIWEGASKEHRRTHK